MGRPILSPLQIQIHKIVMITVISSYPAYIRIIFFVIMLVFQYINALLADTSKFVSEEGGGERMGRPILSPLTIKISSV